MRFCFLLLCLLPSLAVAATTRGRISPVPFTTTDILMIFPLVTIIITIGVIFWHRRHIDKQRNDKQ